MISEIEFQKMLSELREKNRKNIFFKSKMESMIERREKSTKGEFFYISEKYLLSGPSIKKKMQAISKICFRLSKDKKSKKLRTIFYLLNEEKRKFGLATVDIPGQLQNELRND